MLAELGHAAAAEGRDPRLGRQGHGEPGGRALALATGSRPTRSTMPSSTTRSRRYETHYARVLGRETRLFPGRARRPGAPRRRWASARGRHQQVDALRAPASRRRPASRAISSWSSAATPADEKARSRPAAACRGVFGIAPAPAADGRRFGQRRRRPRAPPAARCCRALRLQRGRAGAKPRRRWYSCHRWTRSPIASATFAPTHDELRPLRPPRPPPALARWRRAIGLAPLRR